MHFSRLSLPYQDEKSGEGSILEHTAVEQGKAAQLYYRQSFFGDKKVSSADNPALRVRTAPIRSVIDPVFADLLKTV
jgi:hypothetical protein